MVRIMSPAPDPNMLVGDVLRLGTIETVDLQGATCTVRMGEIVTDDLPWISGRAGKTRIWSPPSVGEQCLLLCPGGDDSAGLVLSGIYYDDHPAPSAEPYDLIEFADGAVLSYDPEAHALVARLPAGATAHVIAPGGITLEGDVTIRGDMRVEGDAQATGTVTGDEDVVGGGKSLKGHRHLGVTAGTAVSGLPQ